MMGGSSCNIHYGVANRGSVSNVYWEVKRILGRGISLFLSSMHEIQFLPSHYLSISSAKYATMEGFALGCQAHLGEVENFPSVRFTAHLGEVY